LRQPGKSQSACTIGAWIGNGFAHEHDYSVRACWGDRRQRRQPASSSAIPKAANIRI